MDSGDGLIVGMAIIIVILGAAAIIGGIVTILRSARLSHRCTAETNGTVTDILQEGSKRRRREESVEPVKAANEAIAAKKRQWEEEKRERLQEETDAATATWRPVISYEIDGVMHSMNAQRCVRKGVVKVGRTTVVHYDPAKPQLAWAELDGLPRTMGITLCVSGVVLIVLACMCAAILPDAFEFTQDLL